ncbi:MAG TPA: hypothetical protein VIC25_00260 [Caulobacteraceae bacterium]|jgi:hypothetical protein
MAAFSFAYNPFVILPISIRASARDVEDAFQKRVAARPQDEAALGRARRLLLEPDSRLAAEIAWLIDVGPKEAVTLLGAMAGGNQAALLDALNNQPALSKANVAADACGRLKSAAFLRPLAAAHRALDPTALATMINEIHAAIPMTQVSARQVEAALRAITMLHAGSAVEAIAAQVDPAFSFAAATQGPDAAEGAFLEELTSQFHRRFPPLEPQSLEPANDPAEAEDSAAPSEPVAVTGEAMRYPSEVALGAVGGAFADVHAPEHALMGDSGSMASAFMDAQLIFSAHDRFDTYGNSRRVRKVLYVLGASLACVVVLVLVLTKGPPDSDAGNASARAVNYAMAPPPPPPVRHAKKECVMVSGASYCTQ